MKINDFIRKLSSDPLSTSSEENTKSVGDSEQTSSVDARLADTAAAIFQPPQTSLMKLARRHVTNFTRRIVTSARDSRVKSVKSVLKEQQMQRAELELEHLSMGKEERLEDYSGKLKKKLAGKIGPSASWDEGTSELDDKGSTVKQSHIDGIGQQYERKYVDIELGTQFGSESLRLDDQHHKDFFLRPGCVFLDGKPLPLNEKEFPPKTKNIKEQQFENHHTLALDIKGFSGEEGFRNFQKMFHQGLIQPALISHPGHRPIDWPSSYEIMTTDKGVTISKSHIFYDRFTGEGMDAEPNEPPFTYTPVKVDLSISWSDLKNMKLEEIEGKIYSQKPFQNTELDELLDRGQA